MRVAWLAPLAALLSLGCIGPPPAVSQADLAGPPADFSGMWTGELFALSLQQTGTSVTGRWLCANNPGWVQNFTGQVRGHALQGTMSTFEAYSEGGQVFYPWMGLDPALRYYSGWINTSFALTLAADEKTARFRANEPVMDAQLFRLVVGPSSESQSQPGLQGGLIVQLPVGPDGRPLTAYFGAPPRPCLAYLQYVRADTGIQAFRAISSLAPPQGDILWNEVPPPPDFDATALRRVRRAAPYDAKQPVQLDGQPAWIILSPTWSGGSPPGGQPQSIVAEIYRQDPDTDASPTDLVPVAVRKSASWAPDEHYLQQCSRLTKLHLRDEGGLDKVEVIEIAEPAPDDPELLATGGTVAVGRWRNGLLLDAKAKTLPRMLRESKTQELADLQLRLEKAALNLVHEKERSKDRAQSLVESNRPATPEGETVDGLREAALVCQERVEIVKAMIASIQQETTNRGR